MFSSGEQCHDCGERLHAKCLHGERCPTCYVAMKSDQAQEALRQRAAVTEHAPAAETLVKVSDHANVQQLIDNPDELEVDEDDADEIELAGVGRDPDPPSIMHHLLTDNESKNFFGAQPPPARAEMTTGEYFAKIYLTQPMREVAGAMEPATRQRHLCVARMVQLQLRDLPYLQQEPLANALVKALGVIRAKRHWRASTLLTMAASLQSLLARLDVYAPGLANIKLRMTGVWTDAMRLWSKQVNVQEKNQSQPLQAERVEAMIEQLLQNRQRSAAMLLVVSWSHAARVRNTLTLKPVNFKTGDKDKNQHQSITWTNAKTTAKVGPYTTFSTYGAYQYLVQECIEQGCPWTTRDALAIRKLLDDGMDLRSIRRGALQAMAAQKTPPEVLRTFSGHASEKSLLIYLGHGVKADYRRDPAAQASHFLWLNAEEAN